MPTAAMDFSPTSTEQRILCCSCGTPITPNPANMCINCIRSEVDITEGIPKQATLHFCKGCDRYLQPPNAWIAAELESRELLTLCIKKLRGLNKIRLVDAGFIWTEPHSRRIKVKLTIQKEVFASTILQQVFVVEYIVATQQCDECARVAASLTWKAVVQVRQKVAHKRTFLWLEQLILKHGAHKDTVNIKETRDGMDFFYSARNHAVKMVEFLHAVVPVRVKTSEQLISSDIHNNTTNYKFTYSVEIVPLCKDDLVVLPVRLARSLSAISPLTLVHRVGSSIGLVDPTSLKTGELRNTAYWDEAFPSLCESKELSEFYVIDVQPMGETKGKVARANDFSRTFLVRTHLGNILKPGDHVLGYDLVSQNFNSEHFDALVATRGALSLPDVILVRKSYPNRRKKSRPRNWKLKGLAKEEEDGKRTDRSRTEQDYEQFLRDLEEDVELREMVNLYKVSKPSETKAEIGRTVEESEAEDDEEDFPEVKLEELMEDLTIDEPDRDLPEEDVVML